MRLPIHTIVMSLCAAGLLALPTLAGATHAGDPRTQPALGESFRGRFDRPFIANSDLAFWGSTGYAGRYDGFRVLDISAPGNPKEISQVTCFGAQGDVAVWDILVRAVDSAQILPNNDLDRACEGTNAPAGTTGFEGLQIFDVSDPANPRSSRPCRPTAGRTRTRSFPIWPTTA